MNNDFDTTVHQYINYKYAVEHTPWIKVKY